MALAEYERKRSFAHTPEPKGDKAPEKGPLHFVVQKHDASHLHYDFRLELDGVLKSWAVPKGPSLNPEDKRLAMETEDHPYAYKDFEGSIPKGEYGAGDVIIWDEGVYASTKTIDPNVSRKNIKEGYQKGEISFLLYGKKLRGAFTLVKIQNRGGAKDNAWLLIKSNDEYASTTDVTQDVFSVKSGKPLPRDTKEYAPLKQPRARRRNRDPMPHHIQPMLAALVDEPFDREGWYFETKWDGYRAIAEIEDGNVQLYSRAGNDFRESYPSIVEALQRIEHDCVLDGEIIAIKGGRPDFQALQDATRTRVPLQYAVFDMLYLDGEDMRELPLSERKERLRGAISGDTRILISEHFERQGIRFFALMREQGLEGMMAKNASSRYRGGVRSNEWLKVKHMNRQEAVIIGFTRPRGARKHIGALVLGAYAHGSLAYIGHSGGGLTDQELEEMHARLSKIRRTSSSINERIPVNAPVTWVTPKYVCEIAFTEWTGTGRMRHPLYLGLRPDKNPYEVFRELPSQSPEEGSRTSAAQQVEISHRDKIFWPKEGYTKGDLIEYYDHMADTILAYLRDRPQNMNRHPDGWQGKSFYQKDVSGMVPPFARSVSVWSESNNKDIEYLVCDNRETLLYMANLGCIEVNPWSSRIGNLERPDYMIFDIDPHTHPFDDVITVAQKVHDILDRSCGVSYPKTSGKTGIHILVPLGGRYTYDHVRTFAELIMRLVNSALPELTSLERNPRKRGGKIYLDYLQNRVGQTIAAPYSVRPFVGATVSTPLLWREVKKGLDPSLFTMVTLGKRLEEKGDLMEGLLGPGVDLVHAIRFLQEEFEHPRRTQL